MRVAFPGKLWKVVDSHFRKKYPALADLSPSEKIKQILKDWLNG